MKKVGIIGSGSVAKALGNGFIKYGYEVMLSSRDISKLSDWKEQAGSKGKVGSFAEAAKFGTLIVLAVKGTGAEEAIEEAGPQNLNGKTVIDTTNPIADAPPDNGVLKFFTSLEESLMERLQFRFPDINFVKAFNCVNNGLMVNPRFKEGKPSMFICGNNVQAKEDVKHILELFEWEVEDMGKVEASRAIEVLAMLWCIPGFLQNQWSHAFKLLNP
jgi:hypothetical protein